MSRSDPLTRNEPPWYRQFWPWFLILLPATVVCASLYSVWLASSARNDLVADDYYREGLAINERLGAQQAAEIAGLTASLVYSGNGIDVALTPAARAGANPVLSLRHPVNASLDSEISLLPGSGGLFGYRGVIPDLSQRWYVTLQGIDPESGQKWELRGEIPGGAPGGSIQLFP